MMSEGDVIFVTCNESTHRFFIEDVEPEFLQATFELMQPPMTLFSVTSNLAIPVAKKAERLKPGESYYIKSKTKRVDAQLDEYNTYSKYKDSIKHPDGKDELVLNSLIASTAVYYNVDESEMRDGGSCGKYLEEQLNNHNFEYIVRNKFGSTNFLIAKVYNY